MSTKKVRRNRDDRTYARVADRQRHLANEALAGLLVQYPPADKIGPREWSWTEKGKPKPADIEQAHKDLAIDIERYEDLRRRGGDALSVYDLTVSSTNNGPYALAQALRLKVAHISYARGRLSWLENKLGIQKGYFMKPAAPAQPA